MQWVTLHRQQNRWGGYLGYVPSLKRILRKCPPPLPPPLPFKLLGMVTFVTAFAVTDH